jgi:hypothetical protein
MEIPYEHPEDPGFDERLIPIEAIEQNKGVIQMSVAKKDIEGKKQRKAKNETDDLPLFQIQWDLIDWMTGQRLAEGLKKARPFDAHFCTYFTDDRKRSIEVAAVDKNYLATASSEHEIYDELTNAMIQFQGPARQYCLAHRLRKELVAAYIAQKHKLRLSRAPSIFCFQSEKKIAFNRVIDPAWDFPFRYGHPEFAKVAPLYSDILDRSDNPLVPRQFFGSLCDLYGSKKQTLHLLGPGNSGKTVTMEIMIECLFGERGFLPIDSKDILNDSFVLENFLNKMVIFADEVRDMFYHSNLYKRLTGALKHRINPKGKTAFEANIQARIIATSNDIPSIPADQSVLNRILFVRLSPIVGPLLERDKFKEQLLKEVPYILVDAISAYKLLEGSPIVATALSHDESIDIGSAKEQVFFDQYFVHSPGAKRLPLSKLKSKIIESGSNYTNYKAFRDFLAFKFGCIFDARDASGSIRVVTNITAKGTWEIG